MSILTTFFNLIKPAKTDPAAIAQINANMDTIDAEMHRPPLTVNDIQPDPTTRNIQITTVPLADNLTSDETQINQGTYIIRSAGGEAPIQNGAAWLSNIIGNMVKTGVVEESITPSVTVGADHLEISIDRDTFVEYVQSSGTITLNYTSAWSVNPELYGITVTGTPVNGDQIQVVYVKANRGTIKIATPTTFISTGWNLYNHAVGYARVSNYSEEYGFMIGGTYTSIAFSETLNGEQTPILPVNGAFNVPSDGYVFVTGGNGTDTMIWMTWSDWVEAPNGGVFAAYSQTSVDISGVMVNFPYGLMKIGNVYDEIDFNTQSAYSRIERLAYTDANLEEVIASGVVYDVDENYIYAAKTFPTTYTISIDGEYTVNDHGTEMFLATTVPVTAASLYGNDLKGKLRTDVLTISQQTLNASQKQQVRNNIDVPSNAELNAVDGKFTNLFKYVFYETTVASLADGAGIRISANTLGISTPAGYKPFAICRFTSGSYRIPTSYVNIQSTGDSYVIGLFNASGAEQTNFKVGIGIVYVKTGMGI